MEKEKKKGKVFRGERGGNKQAHGKTKILAKGRKP